MRMMLSALLIVALAPLYSLATNSFLEQTRDLKITLLEKKTLPQGKVTVRILNHTDTPITFCVTHLAVRKNDDGSAIFWPHFIVEKRKKQRWHIFMVFVDDISPSLRAVLKPGQSQNFSINRWPRGTFRVILEYLDGDVKTDCGTDVDGDRKKIVSDRFVVGEPYSIPAPGQ